MNAPAHHVVHALRRFIGLRSAWRRSLAMEPREGLPPAPLQPLPSDRAPGAGTGGTHQSCCCHS